MKADSFRIAKVFSGGGDVHYVLPHFQREYTWEKPQWQALLADALAIHDEMGPPTAAEADETTPPGRELEHFLGSLVVINDGTVRGNIPVFKLVDGQQRLTTISLLLHALGRIAGDRGNKPLAKRVKKMLVNADEDGDLFFKLLPTTKYGDRSTYTAILQGEPIPATDSRIGHAYTYLLADLESRIAASTVGPDRLFKVLTNAFQVVFIDLNRDESPYRIFESLNGKGKPLSQADLVRNYIAMKLPGAGQEQVFETQWARIETLLQERRQVGRSRLGELTAFLRHYLAMRSGVLCSEEHVYARFRDRAEREFVGDGVFAEEIATLRRFAEHYDKLLRPGHETLSDVRQAMERLNVLEVSTAYPFLLAASDAHATGTLTTLQLRDVLAVLENYLVRRFLAGEPTNFLNKLFPSLWGQMDKADPVGSLKRVLSNRGYPGDARLRQLLATRPLYDKSTFTRDRTTLVLDAVNRHLSAGTGGYTVLSGASTIEHILPQSMGPEWLDELGPNAEDLHREYVHTLGNLTLVTQDWNSSLSNAPFAIKRKRLAGHALRLNSDYFSEEIAAWDEAAIRARSAFLVEEILAIWPALAPGAVQAAPAASASFHGECVERIEQHLGLSFIKRGPVTFSTGDGKCRLMVAVSKRYERSATPGYWFAFHPSQQAFLEEGERGYAAFGCGSAETVFLFALDDFLPFVARMGTTATEDRHYWHVKIYESGSRFVLGQPGMGNNVDITTYRLESKPIK